MKARKRGRISCNENRFHRRIYHGYISARFSIASTAKEIYRARGRRGNLPDLVGARVKVAVTINVGTVCPRHHLDTTHIDVKIQPRVKRLLMLHAGNFLRNIHYFDVTFSHKLFMWMCPIHVDPLCITYVR